MINMSKISSLVGIKAAAKKAPVKSAAKAVVSKPAMEAKGAEALANQNRVAVKKGDMHATSYGDNGGWGGDY